MTIRANELLDELRQMGVAAVESTVNDDGSVSVRRTAEVERADGAAPVGATEWIAHGDVVTGASLEDALQALVDTERG